MPSHRTLSGPLPLALVIAALAACSSSGDGEATGTPPLEKTPAATDPAQEPDVLVTVNGVPIREADLQFVLASKHRGRGADARATREALETIIDQELNRQKAQELGLHRDPDYRRKLHFMQAPVNDFQRDELSDRYVTKLLEETTQVSEADARAHFEEAPERFQTRYRVSQILVRGDEARIQALKQKIDAGSSFDDVAAGMFDPKTLAEGDKPWRLEPLRWDQLPGPWQKVLGDLEPGQVSDIIRGPNERAWILRLDERTRDESITFDQVKPQVIQALQAQRARDKAQEATRTLRKNANIVRVRDPEAVPPAPEPDE